MAGKEVTGAGSDTIDSASDGNRRRTRRLPRLKESLEKDKDVILAEGVGLSSQNPKEESEEWDSRPIAGSSWDPSGLWMSF